MHGLLHGEVRVQRSGINRVIRARERQIRRLQKKELRFQQAGQNIVAGKIRREYEYLAGLNAQRRGSTRFVLPDRRERYSHVLAW